MSPDKYFEVYSHLVTDRRIDPDEAECIVSDLEDALNLDENRGKNPYDLLAEIGY